MGRVRAFIIGILLITPLATSCDFGISDKKHPSDAELIKNFHEHRPGFDELIQMFTSDQGLGRVGADFTRSSSFFEKCTGANSWSSNETGVDDDRLREYRKRFATLGLPKGIEGYCDKEHIWLYASTRGLSVTGSSKGYVYVTKMPSPVVESLDDYWSADGKSFTAFRHVEGNWYLYFTYED